MGELVKQFVRLRSSLVVIRHIVELKQGFKASGRIPHLQSLWNNSFVNIVLWHKTIEHSMTVWMIFLEEVL